MSTVIRRRRISAGTPGRTGSGPPPLERWFGVLAPLAVAALAILWAKVIVEGLRGLRRDRDDSVTNP